MLVSSAMVGVIPTHSSSGKRVAKQTHGGLDLCSVVLPCRFFVEVKRGYMTEFKSFYKEVKVRIIQKIQNMELSVCEDVGGHYSYWQYGFNPNPDDCCNLRKEVKT